MLKEGIARSHDCQIWRTLCPWVSTLILYMLIPWTSELISLIFQYLLFFFPKYLFIWLPWVLVARSFVVAHELFSCGTQPPGRVDLIAPWYVGSSLTDC